MAGEDDEEIAALRARLTALEGQAQAPQPATLAKKKGGCSTVIGATVALIALVYIFDEVTGDADKSATRSSDRPAPTAPPSPTCNSTWARKAVEIARGTPLIRDMEASSREGLVVVVRRPQWEFLDPPQQKVMAAAIDCALAGPGYLSALRFRYSMQGVDVLAYKATDLHRLRRDGYGNGPPEGAD